MHAIRCCTLANFRTVAGEAPSSFPIAFASRLLPPRARTARCRSTTASSEASRRALVPTIHGRALALPDFVERPPHLGIVIEAPPRESEFRGDRRDGERLAARLARLDTPPCSRHQALLLFGRTLVNLPDPRCC